MRPVLFPVFILVLLAAGCTGQSVSDGSKTTLTTIEIKPVTTVTFNPVTFFTTTTEVTDEQIAKTLCSTFCNENLRNGVDLSAGPCIRNPFISPSSWVCDVAHNPRQPIDDLPENQCSAYISGEANHFVEVTPDCKFIRAT